MLGVRRVGDGEGGGVALDVHCFLCLGGCGKGGRCWLKMERVGKAWGCEGFGFEGFESGCL